MHLSPGASAELLSLPIKPMRHHPLGTISGMPSAGRPVDPLLCQAVRAIRAMRSLRSFRVLRRFQSFRMLLTGVLGTIFTLGVPRFKSLWICARAFLG